ncbi:hypothetical protein PINS_up011950 [Pythium insidiosum]|nr:hypothetical protein PINS_up011950 [Pythium insidiosum]
MAGAMPATAGVDDDVEERIVYQDLGDGEEPTNALLLLSPGLRRDGRSAAAARQRQRLPPSGGDRKEGRKHDSAETAPRILDRPRELFAAAKQRDVDDESPVKILGSSKGLDVVEEDDDDDANPFASLLIAPKPRTSAPAIDVSVEDQPSVNPSPPAVSISAKSMPPGKRKSLSAVAVPLTFDKTNPGSRS